MGHGNGALRGAHAAILWLRPAVAIVEGGMEEVDPVLLAGTLVLASLSILLETPLLCTWASWPSATEAAHSTDLSRCVGLGFHGDFPDGLDCPGVSKRQPGTT